jgi:hypothetical protein
MGFHGSASCNQSPILFKGGGNTSALNIIIHMDGSSSMSQYLKSIPNGNFILNLQDFLLENKIGKNVTSYPNIYSYFDSKIRNYSSNFTIDNSNGALLVQNTFLLGQSTGIQTKNDWAEYYKNGSNFNVNICDENSRLEFDNISEDVHGNLWSIYTTPNSILSGIPGRIGSIISSPTRTGSKTVIITASDEQINTSTSMIDVPVNVNYGTRILNGINGEILTREYQIISMSSYTSNDNYDGVLFYGDYSSYPYGYVIFNTPTTYTIIRSSSPPLEWAPIPNKQLHNTLLLAEESHGALFKIDNITLKKKNVDIDNTVALAKCIADFLSETL